MVSSVLHDVVNHVANLHGEGEVHGGGHKGLCFGPGRFFVVPRHPHVGVVNIDHKTNHGVPEQERHQHAHQQCEPDGLACGACCIGHHTDPQDTKHGDQQTVLEENGTACGHVCFVGEKFTLPPNFNQVVQTGRPSTAIKVLQQAIDGAECCKLFGCEGRPDKVNALQVGVTVVDHVVARVPQAVGRERVQECVTANPFVQLAVGREALVACVMTQDEQTTNHKACRQATNQLQPDSFEENGTRNQSQKQSRVEHQQCKSAQGGALRQRQQPLADDFAVRHLLIHRDRLSVFS